ncbi:hypothetical protein GIB67_013643 [Kingdonia uniflora]|uniref:Uncharacterized protein n=1 Tax=Kingdonia uniflora TaxID=39325 RepID=A0A7J7NQ38_9MAGN|nr:hypothetical protein GIB67_013643 [Kingdonia uniflora]
MAPSTTQQILHENKSRETSTITALALNQRALSDVSCLVDFKNLERLDLGFNILSSIEGLGSCVNLKWLSVSQNKLKSLKGIEGLSKLTVLNAARNKLTSMDEVMSLVSLRALILNDNEISSVCRLDLLKDLNTLVLSRNPLRNVGDSLVKAKSIAKLSLSNCQLESIGSSFKSLLYLKEVRLAHNEITVLPAELASNIKLQNLDLGNNCITRSSDLKVLSSLHNLRHLNLQGNPIAEKNTSAKKVVELYYFVSLTSVSPDLSCIIKKLVPKLLTFNNKPLERSQGNENSKTNHANETKEKKEVKGETHKQNENISRKRSSSHNKDSPLYDAEVPDVDREVDLKWSKPNKASKKDISHGCENPKNDGESKQDPIDDVETPSMELISPHRMVHSEGSIRKKIDKEDVKDNKPCGQVAVVLYTKRKKAMGNSALPSLSSSAEVGNGGPSTWDA